MNSKNKQVKINNLVAKFSRINRGGPHIISNKATRLKTKLDIRKNIDTI